jgi:hypothetical protein
VRDEADAASVVLERRIVQGIVVIGALGVYAALKRVG